MKLITIEDTLVARNKLNRFGLRPDPDEAAREIGAEPIIEIVDVVATDYNAPTVRDSLCTETYREIHEEKIIENKSKDLRFGADTCTVLLFGNHPETKASVAVKITNFQPWVRMLLPPEITGEEQKRLVDKIVRFVQETKRGPNLPAPRTRILTQPKLYGLFLDSDEASADGPVRKKFPVLEMAFRRIDHCYKAMRRVRSDEFAAEFPGVELTDDKTAFEIKALCTNGVNPASFAKISNSRLVPEDRKITNCTLELEASIKDIEPIKRDETAPRIICAFDGEMYSFSGAFPH